MEILQFLAPMMMTLGHTTAGYVGQFGLTASLLGNPEISILVRASLCQAHWCKLQPRLDQPQHHFLSLSTFLPITGSSLGPVKATSSTTN
jgi:hypothetical protein